MGSALLSQVLADANARRLQQRGGRGVFPHTTPDGCLVNLYGRAVGTAEQVQTAKRHDHLPGTKGSFNATALQDDAGPLWVCDGVGNALVLIRSGGRVHGMTTHQQGAYRRSKTGIWRHSSR
jgi:hypothetical protein